MEAFGVHFQVDHPELFDSLENSVSHLKRLQESGEQCDVTLWQTILPPSAFQKLVIHTEADRSAGHDLRANNIVMVTSPQEAMGSSWDIGEIQDAVEAGDYEVVGVERKPDGTAELQINPFGYPYGGLGAFIALLEAYGMTVLGVNECGNYESFDESRPSDTPLSSQKRKWWKFWK